jgi:hypothetical protein
MHARARRDFALARVEYGRLRASGENTDTEVALFEADHGSAAHAVVLGRRAWRHAPSVRSADARGWALTRAGHPRAGARWARRALRLGSRDPLFLYHAGIAALRSGDVPEARRLLRASLGAGADLSPLVAARARRALKGTAAG